MKFRLVHILLLVPFVAMLWVGFYNRAEPEWAGIPFFYWFQMLWIPLGALLLWPVYRAEERDARDDERQP
ncbi:MAG TPA: DUF3311 domain-containing protein [Rhizomicrobium sp.]|jgi:hypothetical protein|nr:DUF3311 domain-containing protein [Rhizomicrobium sp.]